MSASNDSAIKNITIQEIQNQPNLWPKVHATVAQLLPEIERFFSSLPKENFSVIFTGAGSSAFIGEAVAPLFQKRIGLASRSIPTTDIVTHPREFLPTTVPYLLVSFARSGNSPESLAAVALANELNPHVYHLIVTCNAEGALAKLKNLPRTLLLVLPEEANDQGLAMTGSVTSMMLATMLIADHAKFSETQIKVQTMSKIGSELLASSDAKCKDLARLPFQRLVCLGSGPLLGVAREAHLKVQELSDGQVIAKFDSFLGFRHGPKAVVNDKTLLLYFCATDAYVQHYEQDLIQSVKSLHPMAMARIQPHSKLSDFTFDPSGTLRDENYLLPLYVLPAQLLAVSKSQGLGLDPDSPSARGAIHRVVQGVTIYPFSGAHK